MLFRSREGEPFNSQEYFLDQAYCGAWALSGPQNESASGAAEAEPPRPSPQEYAAKAPGPAAPQQPSPAKKLPTIKVRTRRSSLLGRLLGQD